MDKKLTDNEIVKGLECCNQNDCKTCPYGKYNTAGWCCMPKLRKDALDLINRLQAENERLTTLAKLGNTRANDYRVMRDRALKAEAENERYEKALRQVLTDIKETNLLVVKDLQSAKAEAYKECIEKVKEEIAEALKSNYKARAEKENKEINSYLDNLFWNYCNGKIDCLRGIDDFLDNLLKELVGDVK